MAQSENIILYGHYTRYCSLCVVLLVLVLVQRLLLNVHAHQRCAAAAAATAAVSCYERVLILGNGTFIK